MKRTLVFAVVAVVLLVTIPSVSSALGRDRSAVSSRPIHVTIAAPRLAPIPPPDCNAKDPVDVYVRCVNRYLTKLSRQVNRSIDSLNHLYNDCLVGVPITQYGSSDGTSGYSFTNPGETTPFLTTAIDYTEDTTTDQFDWMAIIQDSCIK